MTGADTLTADQIRQAASLLGVRVGTVDLDQMADRTRPHRPVTVLLAELAAGVSLLQVHRDMMADGLTQPEMVRLVAAVGDSASGGDPVTMMNLALWWLHLARHTVTATGDDPTGETIAWLIGPAAGLLQCRRGGTDQGDATDLVEIGKARMRAAEAVRRIDAMLPKTMRRASKLADQVAKITRPNRR